MKKTERYFYPAVFVYNPDSEIAVLFPDLDCATSGEDETDALLSARDLLGCVLCGLEEDGEPIPKASSLSTLELKENEKAVLVDVYMPSFRMANVNKAVNRTVTLPAWLNALAIEHKKLEAFKIKWFNIFCIVFAFIIFACWLIKIENITHYLPLQFK